MKIAFIFPGQGSQSVGMFNAWQENSTALSVIEECSQALDQNLLALMSEGPAETLGLTTNTQPVMLSASIAMYKAWLNAGGKVPQVMAGHSLGEYTALTAAGVFNLPDAVKLVRIRANAMQDAVPVGVGGMAAILGLSGDTVIKVCQQASQDEIVEAVNFNSPEQVVIAGNVAAVERACQLAKEQGAKRAMVLPVSAPFHSSLLKPAAQVLSDALNKLSMSQPAIPVINNVDVQSPSDPSSIKNALTRQAWNAVQWVETINAIKAQGVTHLVECGPGKVLSGLTRRIDRDLVSLSITDPASMQVALETLQG